MIIELDDRVRHSSIDRNELSANWQLTSPESYKECQRIGDKWYLKKETCLLKVPSAVIQQESNYIINPFHLDFKKVKLIGVEEVLF